MLESHGKRAAMRYRRDFADRRAHARVEIIGSASRALFQVARQPVWARYSSKRN